MNNNVRRIALAAGTVYTLYSSLEDGDNGDNTKYILYTYFFCIILCTFGVKPTRS